MRDQRVISLAEKLFTAATSGYLVPHPALEVEKEMRDLMPAIAKNSIVAAEKFYEALQEDEKPDNEPQQGKTCTKTATQELTGSSKLLQLRCEHDAGHSGRCHGLGMDFDGTEGG